MNNEMSNEEIKNFIEILNKIKKYCSFVKCTNCIFVSIDEPCMFFNKPWQWELGELESKL